MSIDSAVIPEGAGTADQAVRPTTNKISVPRGDNASAGHSFIRHAKLIGGLTLVSRFMGLGREVVAGHYLGTGLVASAFTVAFTIPNLFRKLFGEGALSAAFIPLYTQAIKREGQASANNFAVAAVNLLCAILIAITIVGEAVLLALIFGWSAGHPERLLMLKLTAIMLPYVLLICGTAFLSGILQVHHRFGMPAAAPIVLNICHIAVLLIGARIVHLQASTPEPQAVVLQTRLAYWLAGFVLVAGVFQVMMLGPSLRAVGFRLRPVLHVWTPAIKKMARLSVPVAIGAGVLQLSVLLDKGIAFALMQDVDPSGHIITHFNLFGHLLRYPMVLGAPRRLDLAQFLYQFPLGVFAIALATAIFPNLSSDAMEADRQRFRTVLRQGIEAALWEGLPASIGLILVRGPAVRLLFQHGHIHAQDADLIAQSVFFYAGAIWAFSVLQIINRAYYAIHDTLTPVLMSIVNIVINLIVEIPLLWWLGESAMALGTLVSFVIQAIVMIWMLDKKISGLAIGKSLSSILRMGVATAVMAVACLLIQHVPGYPTGATRTVWAAQLTILIGTGGLVYLFASWIVGLEIANHLRPKRKAA
jgi:putative peptidoglycan lipid II flippase